MAHRPKRADPNVKEEGGGLPPAKRQKLNRQSIFSGGNVGKPMLKLISVYADESDLEFPRGVYTELITAIVSNMR